MSDLTPLLPNPKSELENPYPGPRSFTEADARNFFVADLHARWVEQDWQD